MTIMQTLFSLYLIRSCSSQDISDAFSELDYLDDVRYEYNSTWTDQKIMRERLIEERFGALEMNTEMALTWIDINNTEYWQEVYRINSQLADLQQELVT